MLPQRNQVRARLHEAGAHGFEVLRRCRGQPKQQASARDMPLEVARLLRREPAVQGLGEAAGAARRTCGECVGKPARRAADAPQRRGEVNLGHPLQVVCDGLTLMLVRALVQEDGGAAGSLGSKLAQHPRQTVPVVEYGDEELVALHAWKRRRKPPVCIDAHQCACPLADHQLPN